MSRFVVFSVLLLFFSGLLSARDEEKPAISITSPDTATTFAYGSIKSHALIWNKNKKVPVAMVTFTDADENFGQSNEDTHEFRLPGIRFDEATGVFLATTTKGGVIPVAHIKKTLF